MFRAVMMAHMAGAAARITGRSVFNQRNDARSGFAPDGEVQGRKQHYSALPLAEMLLIQTLADRGIGPLVGKRLAMEARWQVAFWALMQPGAIKDMTDGKFTKLYESKGWDQATFVITSSEPFEYFKYMIVWSSNTVSFVDDLEPALREADADLKRGVMVLLDLEALGQALAERAGEPLVEIHNS
jgi:hypothetical protein